MPSSTDITNEPCPPTPGNCAYTESPCQKKHTLLQGYVSLKGATLTQIKTA